ncbi:MAG: hypothetical protein IT385_04705 [Deltaproteobacteria bacterium]|nr:hypothetical protein [Deltaproteobacteria bacterium]
MADTIKPVGAIGRAPEVQRHELPAWARDKKDAVTPWSPTSRGGSGGATADKRAPDGERARGGAGAPTTPRSRTEKRPRVQGPTRPQAPAGTAPGQPPEHAAAALDAALAAGQAPGAAATPTIPPGSIVLTPEELEAHEQAMIEAYREPYLEAARRLDEAAAELVSRTHEDIVLLAARLAEALLHRALKEDRTVLIEVLQRAFRLAGPLEHVTVRCASEDAELIRERAPGLARGETGRAVDVVVRPSDDISPGGCVLTWEGGVVDARNERRLERLVDAVKNALAEVSGGRAQPVTGPMERVVPGPPPTKGSEP